jgi:hypothetical protein
VGARSPKSKTADVAGLMLLTMAGAPGGSHRRAISPGGLYDWPYICIGRE